jgi:intein/homing endonuclease
LSIPPHVIARGPQVPQPNEGSLDRPGVSGWAKFGLGAAAFTAAGFAPINKGRIWDKYLAGVRAIETGFPQAILRTFRISEFLSPLESWSRISFPTAQAIHGGRYTEYLKNVFGPSIQGAEFLRTGAVFGEVYDEAGRPVGAGLQMLAGTQRGNAIADYYARLHGVPLSQLESLNESILRAEHAASGTALNYREWLALRKPEELQRRIILGARYRDKISIFGRDILVGEKAKRWVARAEVTGQLLRAKAASTAGRLNVLLTKPLEVPVIGDVLARMPGLKSLAVKPTTNLGFLAGYAKKAAIAGLAWKGLEYYDYLRSQESTWATALGTAGGAGIGGFFFKGPGRRISPRGAIVGAALGLYTGLAPRFDEGLFHGLASYFTDANVARARASRAIGLTKSLQEQESVTPGLISLKTALGFGGVGALTLGTVEYARFLGLSAKDFMVGSKKPLSEVFDTMRDAQKHRLAETIWESRLGSKLASTRVGKVLSKARHPMALGFLAGITAWGVISSGLSLLSGNTMAAVPGLNLLGTTDTPEELEAIYSGEEEIPIRKGRWWEFGRCNAASARIYLRNGEFVLAEDVTLNDTLLGADGRAHSIRNIWSRSYTGTIIHFYTAVDRKLPTSITPNHQVPYIEGWQKTKKKKVDTYEVIGRAEDIAIGDYVRVPIPSLKEHTRSLSTEYLIKVGLFLIYQDQILPAQTNWHNGEVQRSRGNSIPRSIELTPELGRLFGYFLAEGNLSYKKDIPSLIETVHAKSERWIVDDIISICEKEFDITPTVRFKKGKKKTDEGCWIVRICSSLLARVFFELFYCSDRQQDKIFPQTFMSAPKNFKEQLIEGYWRGDGHLDRGRYVISSCRENLLEAIRVLLLSFGICPTSPKPEVCNYTKVNHEKSIKYRIGWIAGTEFQNVQNFVWIDNKLYTLIIGIEHEDYDGKVFDYEIDHDEHLLTNGTFLVHNSTPYEGGRIEYYRPHFIHRLRTRSYQKGLYGSEEERWEHDPLLHPLKALFGSDEWKYHYELKYQYERPAPLTSTYFEDVPFVGPLLAATIGKAVKPRKLVRPEEWYLGEGQFLHRPSTRPEEEPIYELGGLAPGAPVSPDEASQLLNELVYRRREAVGLVGFAAGAIQKAATGREEYFENLRTMATMGRETGAEYWLWSHLNLGGGLGTTEPVRRFIPHTRRYLETYNPLANTMPSWMPQDYFLDLHYGNPFDRIPEAEIRLPGVGYETLHPEVHGISPEEYPLIHRLKILGDIAMWSKEYKRTLRQARAADLTPQERMMMETVEEQVRAKKQRRQMEDYVFSGDQLEALPMTIKEIVDPTRVRAKEYGDMIIELQGAGSIMDREQAMRFAEEHMLGKQITLYTPALESRRYDVIKAGPRMKGVAMLEEGEYGRLLSDMGMAKRKDLTDEYKRLRYEANEQLAGRIWEYVGHQIETPLEYLTPISPASKLIRKRSPVEEYVATEAIGTGNAFWDRPIENFIQPAMSMAAYEMGDASIPDTTKLRRDIQEHFDMLKWLKEARLEQDASLIGDRESAREHREAKQLTLFGVDAFGSPVNIMRALPRRERDFYQAFVEAKTEEDRATIATLIPENERRIYLSSWMRREQEAAQAKIMAGIGDQRDDQIVAETMRARRAEGFESSAELERQWMSETSGEIPFDEWLRYKKAEEYFATHSLPGANWLGWHPSVDLDDVKLKYVETLGLDYHDFDLWDARKRALSRKPYISDELMSNMEGWASVSDVLHAPMNASNLSKVLKADNARTTITKLSADNETQYDIYLEDGRETIRRDALQYMGVRA